MNIAELNQLFYRMAKNYDLNDPNIMRRFVHGLSAAENCFAIASALYFNREEREFMYACGLLHDVGRLEQWRLFASFSDSKGRHHELLGAEFLANYWIGEFFPHKKDQALALKLVAMHADTYTGKNPDILRFLPVLQNGDNYANLQYTASGLQRLWVQKDGVTPEVLMRFHNRENLHGIKISTKLDRILQFLSRAYFIDYAMLQKDLLGRKYINCIYDIYGASLNDEDRAVLYTACWNLKHEVMSRIHDNDIKRKLAERAQAG